MRKGGKRLRKWERCCRPPSPQRPFHPATNVETYVTGYNSGYMLPHSCLRAILLQKAGEMLKFCNLSTQLQRNLSLHTSAQLPPSGHRKLYNGSLSGLILGLVQEDIVIRLWCSGNYSTLEMILTLRHKAMGLNYTWQIFSIFLPSIQLCDQRGVGGFIMNLGHFCLSLPISMTRFWTNCLSLKGAYFVITFWRIGSFLRIKSCQMSNL